MELIYIYSYLLLQQKINKLCSSVILNFLNFVGHHIVIPFHHHLLSLPMLLHFAYSSLEHHTMTLDHHRTYNILVSPHQYLHKMLEKIIEYCLFAFSKRYYIVTLLQLQNKDYVVIASSHVFLQFYTLQSCATAFAMELEI